MNAAVRSSDDKSKSKRLGFGYELKSAEAPSVQTARAEFLNNIAEIKPPVVLSLFETCYLPFLELLQQNEHALAALYKEVERSIPAEAYILRQPKFIREKALKLHIPNWQSLEKIESASKLRQALENWTMEHNLTASWCRDDMLKVLRTFEVSDDKRLALTLLPDRHCLNGLIGQSWHSAALERHLSGLHSIFQSSMAVEARHTFLFRFSFEEVTFEVSGPFYKSPTAFRQEVENHFKAANGPKLRGARKHLAYELGEYLEKVGKINTELNLTLPPGLRKADVYFTWLVDYQIPPGKNYRQIAREASKDEKTVREGIQRLASLIGLTLRSNEADKHLGRPKGAKDRASRRRVERRSEKVRGNAN